MLIMIIYSGKLNKSSIQALLHPIIPNNFAADPPGGASNDEMNRGRPVNK